MVPVPVNQVDGSAECTAALAGRRAYPIVRGACMSTPAVPCLARRQATGGSLAWLCAAAPRAVALLRRGRLAAKPGAAAYTVLRQTRGDSGDSEGDVGAERRRGRIGSGSIPSNVQPSGGPNLRAMYLGSALSGFADRMWEFSIPFFLLTLNRADSMLLAILYALVAGVANVLGGPIIGYLVDKQDRLTTINQVLMVQSLAVLLSFVVMCTALSLSASLSGSIAALVFILTLSCCCASLASLASTHAIERDWIKCLNRYEEDGIRRYLARELCVCVCIYI